MKRQARVAAIAAASILAATIGLLAILWHAIPVPAWMESEPPESIVLLDRRGDRLAEFPASPGETREARPLAEFDPLLVKATLAAEDRRFERHPGIDPIALGRACVEAVRNGRSIRGASTITMQTVRLARGRPTTIADRLVEVGWSLVLDAHWSKERILETYLNRAPYGRGTTGASAASRYWFGKPPAVLSPAEAALLAALTAAPSRLDPSKHPARARAARNRVLLRMQRLEWITADESNRARAEALEIVAERSEDRARHFASWVQETARESPVDAARIRTTLDPAVQRTAEAALRRRVRALRGRSVATGAVVVLDTHSADVVALVGSPDWRSPDAGQFNAALSRRQPGSAVKPFTYAVAFAGALRPSTILADVPASYPGPGGSFAPRNYAGGFAGPVSARIALANSWNVPAVEVLRRGEPVAVAAAFQSVGLAIDDPSRLGLGLTLGAGEVSLLDLAAAYATLARGGEWIAPGAVAEVEDRRGQRSSPPLRERRAALDPISCAWVNEILSDPSARGDAFERDGPLEMTGPVAAKTGTSSDWRDAWAILYTSRWTVAVWMGNPDGRPTDQVTGAQGPALVAREILEETEAANPSGPFPVPAGIERRPVCPLSGCAASADCPHADFEPFRSGDSPLEPCRVHQARRIEAGTGLLARSCTPPEEVRRRVFVDLPPRFALWQTDEGLPFSPHDAAACRCGRADCRILDGHPAPLAAADRSLSILRPIMGTVVALDPTLPGVQQQLALEAVAPAGVTLLWKVDGAQIGTTQAPHRIFWSPLPGSHDIEVEVIGGERESASTTLRVLAPA